MLEGQACHIAFLWQAPKHMNIMLQSVLRPGSIVRKIGVISHSPGNLYPCVGGKCQTPTTSLGQSLDLHEKASYYEQTGFGAAQLVFALTKPDGAVGQRNRKLGMLKGLCVVLAILAMTSNASATIVRFNTVLGSYNIRMYDALMPVTVTNFLNYTNTDRYNGTFVHRSVPGFVVQGGGFTFNSSNNTAPQISLSPPINDEPGGGIAGPSNIRGTIAMAKSGPNTVTSQWFVNLGNNSSLDNPARPDGGFSAFGRVLGNGMTVVDAIAALPIFDLDPFPQQTFDTVPLRNSPGGLADRLVFANDVSVLALPAGDYNFDGTVNNQDLAIWQADFGSTTKAEADGNGNGIVDGADFLVWQRSFGQTSLVSTVSAIPEPTSLALAALGILFLASRRR